MFSQYNHFLPIQYKFSFSKIELYTTDFFISVMNFILMFIQKPLFLDMTMILARKEWLKIKLNIRFNAVFIALHHRVGEPG